MLSRLALPGFFMLVSLVATLPAQSQGVLSGPIINPGNGHTYYLLDASTWTQAEAKAQILGGNLVTVNDSAEEAWVYTTFSQFGNTSRNLWIGLYDTDLTVNSTDRLLRRQEFHWISGESVSYTNWSPLEPNNPLTPDPTQVELYGHIWNPDDPFASFWNNYVDDATLFGHPNNGVVEVSAVPEPGSCAMLASLGIVGASLLRKRRKSACQETTTY